MSSLASHCLHYNVTPIGAIWIQGRKTCCAPDYHLSALYSNSYAWCALFIAAVHFRVTRLWNSDSLCNYAVCVCFVCRCSGALMQKPLSSGRAALEERKGLVEVNSFRINITWMLKSFLVNPLLPVTSVWDKGLQASLAAASKIPKSQICWSK